MANMRLERTRRLLKKIVEIHKKEKGSNGTNQQTLNLHKEKINQHWGKREICTSVQIIEENSKFFIIEKSPENTRVQNLRENP